MIGFSDENFSGKSYDSSEDKPYIRVIILFELTELSPKVITLSDVQLIRKEQTNFYQTTPFLWKY